MRILVSGGAGYVGAVTVERLLAAGHSVMVLDDCSTGHPGAVPAGASLSRASYTEGDAVAHLLAEGRIEAILHCAARSLVGESIREPSIYYRSNVVGGIALLEAARASGVNRFVFSSTAAVYGVPATIPITESAALDPINPYGESKRTFEGALRWYGTAYDLRSVSLRYFNVAGASKLSGEDHDPETHLIPNILAAVETDRPVTLFGADYATPDGTPIRDYIHVEDLAEAHLAALEATGQELAGAEPPALALNLGTGSGFSVRQVLRAAEDVVGARIPSTIGPRRAGDPPILVAAAERAHEVLGWTPRQGSLAEMIGSAWAWRQAHPGGYPE
ncbi:MAG TPA: UDP-glucose 4-epimerase GalE [Candidatus Limnocylindrales bacterium]